MSRIVIAAHQIRDSVKRVSFSTPDLTLKPLVLSLPSVSAVFTPDLPRARAHVFSAVQIRHAVPPRLNCNNGQRVRYYR